MATVLQEYRSIIRCHRPNAVCRRVEHGWRIFDGQEAVGSVQIDQTAAWREAERVLIDMEWIKKLD